MAAVFAGKQHTREDKSASVGVAMHNQPTLVPDRRETGLVSPVIAGGVWFEDEPEPDRRRSLVLQLRLPVSAYELAAARYYDGQLCPADLAADENVWGFAAAAIVRHGMSAVELRAGLVPRDAALGRLASPGWLEHCRRRVAEVTGAALHARGGLAGVCALAGALAPCSAARV
jgi:hypothetical protein